MSTNTASWFFKEKGQERHMDAEAMFELEAGMHKTNLKQHAWEKEMKFGFYRRKYDRYVVSFTPDENIATQKNCKTGNVVALNRYLLADPPVVDDPTVSWEYEDGRYNSNRWIKVGADVVAHLERAHKEPQDARQLVISTKIGANIYVFSATVERQINALSNVVRRIRRVGGSLTAQGPAAVKVPDDPAEFLQHYKINWTKMEDDAAASNTCAICLGPLADIEDEGIAIVLEGCSNHGFHIGCAKDCTDPHGSLKCPNCGVVSGAPKIGNQPQDGTMYTKVIHGSLQGFPGTKIIQIDYSFKNGIQGPEHPSPGQPYQGTRRIAYLPDDDDGQDILRMLKIAWERRLIFQVDESMTMGASGGIRVVWNGIHHKTSFNGDHGYPDAGYISRVKDELKQVGIE
eukprot:m.205179 g.205179  ORF g.205179 m.205179 type:complete len:401 (+) comp32907_c1_seq1:204-1406(+)